MRKPKEKKKFKYRQGKKENKKVKEPSQNKIKGTKNKTNKSHKIE